MAIHTINESKHSDKNHGYLHLYTVEHRLTRIGETLKTYRIWLNGRKRVENFVRVKYRLVS